MSLEQKKAVVRRCWQECFNKRNLAIVDEFVATEYVWHGPSQEVSGPEGIKQLITVFLTAFPDLQMTFEDQLGEGDKIASRWTMRGTHQGDLFGVPPTGKQVTFTGLIISRMVGSQITEEWEHFDQLGLLQQLGAVPRI
jgi:predicted ester cyclase